MAYPVDLPALPAYISIAHGFVCLGIYLITDIYLAVHTVEPRGRRWKCAPPPLSPFPLPLKIQSDGILFPCNEYACGEVGRLHSGNLGQKLDLQDLGEAIIGMDRSMVT